MDSWQQHDRRRRARLGRLAPNLPISLFGMGTARHAVVSFAQRVGAPLTLSHSHAACAMHLFSAKKHAARREAAMEVDWLWVARVQGAIAWD
jgi:hypothetical protein